MHRVACVVCAPCHRRDIEAGKPPTLGPTRAWRRRYTLGNTFCRARSLEYATKRSLPITCALTRVIFYAPQPPFPKHVSAQRCGVAADLLAACQQSSRCWCSRAGFVRARDSESYPGCPQCPSRTAQVGFDAPLVPLPSTLQLRATSVAVSATSTAAFVSNAVAWCRVNTVIYYAYAWCVCVRACIHMYVYMYK